MAAQPKVRHMVGSIWSPDPVTVQARHMVGSIWTPDAQPLPAQTGVAAFLALLNANTSTVFTTSNLTVGAPQTTTPNNVNTVVKITALPASGFSGSMNVYYTRRNLADAFPGSQNLGTISSATTIYALLPTINSKYGLNLTTQDINDGPVPAGSTVIAITASNSSYVFKPGTVASVGQSVPLNTAAPITALMGFDNAAGVGPKQATSLLMHFDNSSNLLLDSTGRNIAGSTGTVSQSTTSPKFGAGALSVGTSAIVTVPDSTLLRFTGQDATLEAFVNPSNVTTQNGILFAKDAASPTVYAELQYYQNLWRLYLDSASFQISATSKMAINTWNHIALVSYKGVWYLYENGQLLGQTTGGTFGNNSNAFQIGNFGGKTANFQGLIDEVRISNLARYTAAFTPPSAPFSVD